MIYFVYLFFLLVILTIERYSPIWRKLCRIIIPVVYVFLIGLRGKSIGKDTETYYEHYYYFGEWGCDFVEPGFDWINQIMYDLGYSANDFFLVNAAITLFFIYLALNRLKKEYTVTALCMYLLTFSFLVNGMRQGIACGVFLYAYKYIEERKLISYILLMLFASQFHASAIILIPLYLLGNRHLSEKWYVGIFVFSFIGLFVNLSSYVPSLELLGRDYGTHVEDMRISAASPFGFTVSSLLNVMVLVLSLQNRVHERYSLLFNLMFFSFVLKNLGFSMPIVGRLTIYFSWFVYYLYPIILSKQYKPLFKSMYITRLALVTIIAVIWVHSLFSSANMLMPYKFYWE